MQHQCAKLVGPATVTSIDRCVVDKAAANDVGMSSAECLTYGTQARWIVHLLSGVAVV